VGAGVMAGMGGRGAGVTALLARRSWLLVRGQRGVNGAAGAAEARVGGAAKIEVLLGRQRGDWGGNGESASAAALAAG
jgi:hypothetical protein